MSNILIAFFAYFIDRFFGEFPFKLHPVELIKEWVEFFEEKFYKDTFKRGVLLLIFMLLIVATLSIAIELYLIILPNFICIIASALIASIFITHKALPDSKEESYEATLRNTIVAPIFYLLLLNLPGIIIYKTISTMNSMFEQSQTKHKHYAKATIFLNTFVNYIPSKILTLFIILRSKMNKNENN